MVALAKILKKEKSPPTSVIMTITIFTESHIVVKKQFEQSISIITIMLLNQTNRLPSPISLFWQWLVPGASEKDDKNLVLNNYGINCP